MSGRDRTGTAGALLRILALACISPALLCGQTQRAESQGNLFNDMQSSTVRSTPMSMAQPPGVPLESTVDPDHYFVGPSDILAVNVWISTPLSFFLTVTPEGTLIVPLVGEVKVSDLTLSEAKKRVVAEIRKRYISGAVTVTLTTPRPIVVMATGSVLFPGLFTLTSVDRAHRAIEEANKFPKVEQRPDLRKPNVEASARNIVLKHKDGTLSRVDIPKFLATHEDRWNPFLREGDVLIVPPKDIGRNVVGIYGELNSPGRFEFVQGDSIKDLIQIAQGFTRRARTDSMFFSRLSPDGSTMETRVLNVTNLLEGKISDVALLPGDRVVVVRLPELRGDYRVTILGEVVYPGTYPITRNTTRLTDVVRQAGGVTESASLASSYVTRMRISSRGNEIDSMQAGLGRAGAEEDDNYFNLETSIHLRREFLRVNMVKLFLQHDSTENIVLHSEDTVFIETAQRTVYIFGQVITPGHITYVPGQKTDYYIEQAGGLIDGARSGNIKVIKAVTKQWLSPDETKIEEGDHIWVPRKPERPFGYYLSIIGQTASIISVALSIVILSIQLNK